MNVSIKITKFMYHSNGKKATEIEADSVLQINLIFQLCQEIGQQSFTYFYLLF